MTKRKNQNEIIISVVDCFRNGVCVVDHGKCGYTVYGVDPSSKVSIKTPYSARVRHAERS